MRGEAVPERVRTDGLGDAVFLRQVLHNQEDHLACEACASAVEEHRVGEFRLRVDVQPCAIDVVEKDAQTAVADGYEPFLAALADDTEEAIVFVYIADLQVGKFRNTQSAAIHHLNHGLVAVAGGLA